MVEALIVAVLLADPAVSAIVGTRVYPGKAPKKVKAPFIRLFRAGGAPNAVVSGMGSKGKGRFQLDLWATSYKSVKQLGEAVKSALVGASQFAASVASEVDMSDADDDYRLTIDFSIIYRS